MTRTDRDCAIALGWIDLMTVQALDKIDKMLGFRVWQQTTYHAMVSERLRLRVNSLLAELAQ